MACFAKWITLSLLVTITAPALADELYLQDGSVIHGKILTLEYGKRYIIQVDGGAVWGWR